MWGCWHEMLAINIKGGMSTHIAEGKLHCPHPEFPSQVEGPFPYQHHARNGENAKESSNGGGICKNDLQTKIIIFSPKKYLSTSPRLQITWLGMHYTRHLKSNQRSE